MSSLALTPSVNWPRLLRYSTSFFFSSRRRHTRYWRDWSSDVCSSDLDDRGAAVHRARHGRRRRGVPRRSEERRVGEEGRSRGAPYHLKKNRACAGVIHRLTL